MTHNRPVDNPDKEVRFGLVLYGGVSLAIYMYGVVMELWRVVRASRGAETNRYADVLKLANVDAIVDVISGTSAGGINGVLLAKALATGADLAVLRDFWTEKADLGQLLRSPRELAPRSLLRSDFFEEQLALALREMDRRTSDQPLVNVLDLFVSGTRLRGRIREFIDRLGQTVQTREYRKMFHLKFRRKGYNPADRELGYDRNEFQPQYNQMLLEISRATSAFPGAFEPRLIERRDENSALFFPGEPTAAHFSDGGILHNKPFTETISTIFARMADRPVSRWLLSVEPDPEYYSTETSGPHRAPEVLEVILKAVSQIPMYQSIATDLDRLGTHNERVRSLIDLLRRTEGIISEQFQREVNEGTREEFRTFLERQVLYHAYQSLKLRAVIEELTTRIQLAAPLPDDQREFTEGGVREYLGDPRDMDRVRDFLDTFDDGFRLRRAFYLIDVLDGFTARLPHRDQETFREAHQTLWAQFDRIRSLTWDSFEGGSPAAKRVKGLRGQGGSELTAAVKDAINDVGVTLASGLAGIRTSTLDTCEKIESAIVALKERGARGVAFPPHPFPRIFERYEIRDMFILPIQVLADLGEREEIGFIRISPSAATYIRKAPPAKLAGDTLGHFGGFLSRDWRANDVLWGRLDTAEVLVRVLLEGHPKATVDEQIHRVQEEVTREELPLVWQANPGLNYRAYLEEKHKIGEQELAHLPAEHKVALALTTSQVLRNMLRRLEQGEFPEGLQVGFKYLGKLLGSALTLIRWPATAIWGKDVAARKFATLLLVFLFGWGVLAFSAGIFGLFPLSGQVFSWVLAFVLPFLAWVVILEWRWGLLFTLGLAVAAFLAWRYL